MSVRLRLTYAPPYDWTTMREFLSVRAIPGVERVDAERYMRTISLGGAHGTIEVAPFDNRHALEVGSASRTCRR